MQRRKLKKTANNTGSTPIIDKYYWEIDMKHLEKIFYVPHITLRTDSKKYHNKILTRYFREDTRNIK